MATRRVSDAGPRPAVKRHSSYADQHRASATAQILFRDLNYDVPIELNKVKTTKRILTTVGGVFQPARFTAVMGSSGSGKTTLLNAVAGWCPENRVTGELFVNGTKMTSEDIKQMSCFVQQDDVILETMTVREAVTMSALLRLPNTLSTEQKHKRVSEMIELLHLEKCADNLIGSALLKGISGGERKRVAIAMEMITNPSVLFLDEPTTGLDTYTAYSVISTLRELAHKGHTVVATIHQPSSDIHRMFDDLLLLAEGEILYCGGANQAVRYFDRHGFPCPKYSNPADHIFMNVLNDAKQSSHRVRVARQVSADLNLIKVFHDGSTNSVSSELSDQGPQSNRSNTSHQNDDHLQNRYRQSNHEDRKEDIKSLPDEAGDKAVQQQRAAAMAARIRDLLHKWKQSPEHDQLQDHFLHPSRLAIPVKQASSTVAGFCEQFTLLGRRAWNNQWRHPLMVRGKFGQTVGFSLIAGLIFLQLGHDQKSVQDRQGVLFFLAVNAFFVSCFGVVSIFAGEKAVFQREYGSGMYGLAPYFFSKTLVEIPFLILFPFLESIIVYWMIGFQNIAANFFVLGVVLVLVSNVGMSIGLLTASVFTDLAVALAVMPLCILPLMLFSGFFINSNSDPVYFDWIKYISPANYGFVALAKSEFAGLSLHCSDSQLLINPDTGLKYCPVTSGDDVITQLGFDHQGSVGFNLGMLTVLWIGFTVLSLIALKRSVKSAHRG